VDQSNELEPETKHDLLADSWTKTGFVLFLHAQGLARDSQDLGRSAVFLNQALYYKPFWIPAQTYLAMVYVAEGRLDEARQQLASVAGPL
jgi:type II secretory pathway component PulM